MVMGTVKESHNIWQVQLLSWPGYQHAIPVPYYCIMYHIYIYSAQPKILIYVDGTENGDNTE